MRRQTSIHAAGCHGCGSGPGSGLAPGGEPIIALAGNPNTGKSTIFNALTGLRQHTGNWPGKTVALFQGTAVHQGRRYVLVDLPGTYSLMALSPDEEVTRDFLAFGHAVATVVVVDATALERHLNLALQVLEVSDRVVLAVNLMDEAQRKGIEVDLPELARLLGVPVVGTEARSGKGLDQLMAAVGGLIEGSLTTRPRRVQYEEPLEAAAAVLAPVLQAATGAQLPMARWLALRLIQGDASVLEPLRKLHGDILGPLCARGDLRRWLHPDIVSAAAAQSPAPADATAVKGPSEGGRAVV